MAPVPLSVLLLLRSSPAAAFTATGATWYIDDVPIPYWIGSLGTLDEATAIAAIQESVQAWSDAPCGLAFDYQGRTTVPFGSAPDGMNVISLVDADWPSEPALASAPIILFDGPALLEVDIGLNGQYYRWAVEGADGRTAFDLRGGVTHEVGHMLGLWHSTVPGSTLNPALSGSPEAFSLEADDIEGLCYLYASIGEGGGVGDYCDEKRDCAEGLFCLSDDTQRYCSTPCSDARPCPDRFTCFDSMDGPFCVVDQGCGCTSTPQRAPNVWVAVLVALVWGRCRITRRGADPSYMEC